MAASLFEHGAIRTTEAKAKDLRRFVEKLITVAKRGTLHARRRVIAELQDRWAYDRGGEELGQTIVQRLFNEIGPRYAGRPGGYTRIIRLADRRIGDAGRQVLLQLVEESSAQADGDAGPGSRRKQRAAKRIEAAGRVAADQEQPEAPARQAEERAAEEESPQEAEASSEEESDAATEEDKSE